MKIHSKFRDYYDTAMAHGVDDHVHWVRNLRNIQVGIPVKYHHAKSEAEKKKIEYLDTHEFIDQDIYQEAPVGRVRYGGFGKYRRGRESAYFADREVFFVGFCGKVYPGFQFTWDVNTATGEKVVRNAYTTTDIIKILREFDKKHKTKHTKKFIEGKPEKKSNAWQVNRQCGFNETEVGRYLKKYEHVEFVDYFVDFDSPAFVVRVNGTTPRIEVNPTLVDYEFQKVMDSYTAYQEIEMFMGGVLAERDEIDVPGVSDESLKTGKGFNEWSFKTLPTKHKKRGK